MNTISTTTAGQPEYAGFWLRAVAYVIDLFILGVATIPINVIALYLIGTASGTQGQKDNACYQIMLIATAVCTVVTIIYFSIFESLAPQATPGKMIIKLEVTDVDGKRLSFIRALIRNIAKLISGLFFNIGFLLAAFTGRKQAFHDIVAGCLVVRQHPSTETKWQAVHHKHKTSWKDPAILQANSAPKNIAAVQSQAQLSAATANGEDYSKINLAEVAAQPVPAGAVREPAPQATRAKTAPAPSPVIPAQVPHSEATALVPQPETTALAPQPETTTLAPPPDTTTVAAGPDSTVADPAPQTQPAFLQADLSVFSAQPALPSDLGALPSPAASHADPSHMVCDTCGAVLDEHFSFCIKCMTPRPS
jgi:uncharacterized RDD family membrane protein YckC